MVDDYFEICTTWLFLQHNLGVGQVCSVCISILWPNVVSNLLQQVNQFGGRCDGCAITKMKWYGFVLNCIAKYPYHAWCIHIEAVASWMWGILEKRNIWKSIKSDTVVAAMYYCVFYYLQLTWRYGWGIHIFVVQ